MMVCRALLPLLFVVAGGLAGPTPSRAQDAPADPEGTWRGEIAVPGSPLAFTVSLARSEAGDWSGTVDIPSQGAEQEPLTGIRVVEDSVVFSIEGVPGDPTFRGEVGPERAAFEGDFTQGSQTFPFALERAEAVDLTAALDGLDAWMAEHMDAWNVPGLGLAVVKDGEVAHLAGYGLRDVEDSLPVTEETLFAIGSSTKAFTTSLLGTFVDDGALDWEDRVRAHLPEFALADTAVAEAMTVRDLVTHRSGLPRHDAIWYANPELTRAEVLERLPHLPPTEPLRAAWQYNNLMYMVAGHLMERVGEASWEELIRERLLDPLGMPRSGLSVRTSQSDPDHALPYAERNDSLVRIDFRTIDAVGPAGSINSSAEEMAEWLRLHLAEGTLDGRTILEQGTVEALQTPAMAIASRPSDPAFGVQSYALGWFVDSYRGHFRVHHGGNIDGFSAMVALFPHDELGIVVLTNKNGTPLAEFAARQVADRVLELEPRDWSGEALAERDDRRARTDSVEGPAAGAPEEGPPVVEGTTPSHELDAYAGAYHHPGYGELTVSVVEDPKDGAPLRLHYYDLTFDLEHVHYDVFVTRDPEELSPLAGQRVRFVTAFDGSVGAVEVPLESALSAATFDRAPDSRLTDPAYLDRLTGSYDRDGQTIEVRRQGAQLVATIPGQPSYTLVPDRGTSFTLEAAPQIRVAFEVPEDGDATAVTFHQPNGSFRHERVDG